MVGLLMFHGAGNLLQFPVLGLVLALPTALVLLERLSRLLRIFKGQVADVQPANNDIMQLSFPAIRLQGGGHTKLASTCSFECPPFPPGNGILSQSVGAAMGNFNYTSRDLVNGQKSWQD